MPGFWMILTCVSPLAGSRCTWRENTPGEEQLVLGPGTATRGSSRGCRILGYFPEDWTIAMGSYSSVWCNTEAVRCVRDKAVRKSADLFGWKMYIKANMENREDFLTVTLNMTLNHIPHEMQHQVRTLFPQLHCGHKSKFWCFLQLFIHCPHMSWCKTAPCNKVNLLINSKRSQNHTRLKMCFWTIHQHLGQVSTQNKNYLHICSKFEDSVSIKLKRSFPLWSNVIPSSGEPSPFNFHSFVIEYP